MPWALKAQSPWRRRHCEAVIFIFIIRMKMKTACWPWRPAPAWALKALAGSFLPFSLKEKEKKRKTDDQGLGGRVIVFFFLSYSQNKERKKAPMSPEGSWGASWPLWASSSSLLFILVIKREKKACGLHVGEDPPWARRHFLSFLCSSSWWWRREENERKKEPSSWALKAQPAFRAGPTMSSY